MSTTHITPTPGRIVWYRGADGAIRPAIVIKGNGQFNADLYVFPLHAADTDWGNKATVTHADPEQEPGCLQSWHWMPYQKQQAEKHANEAARADEPKLASTDTSEAAIEREIQANGLTAPRLSPADLDANIVHTEIVKHVSLSGQVLRWAVLTTKNGFAVVGKPSVAVSPANDHAEIGTKVAVDNSRAELWPLMGYALKQALWDKDVSI
jgi:hypothetical protein